MIRFLLKSVFWLSLAFIAIPHFFPTKEGTRAGQNPLALKDDHTVDHILTNSRTAVEIGKLCIDNPAFCQQGASLATSAGSSVLKGSGQLLDYLSERFGNKNNISEHPGPAAEIPAPAQGNIPVPKARVEALRTRDVSPDAK
ncbi:hypothetical protein AAIB41_01665 [Brucella sp. BE17]|uniref:hypothetical protein n=1 Tax=Brucella sp. BE17 TaxID=3142977 RepID=UPI0031BAFC8E